MKPPATPIPERSSQAEHALFLLLFVGFCAIFSGFSFRIAFVQMKPFDILCLIVAPILVAGTILRRGVPGSTGLLLVSASLATNATFAYGLGIKNGLRETLQSVELILFTALLAIYAPRLDWRRMARWFVVCAIVITAYNIYWHLSHGFSSGWKRLDEPKLLFSYAPPVIFGLLMLRRQRAGIGVYVILAILVVLLVFSGERKAQLALFISMGILAAIGFTRIRIYALAALLAIPVLTALIASDPYLQQQFTSITQIGSERDFTLAEMLDERSGVTQSNGQRLFALDVSRILVAENPVLGVGTNGYQIHVSNNYPELPDHYLLSIHNEFQRILVETGLVGLALYLLAWVRTAFLASSVWQRQGIRAAGLYAMFYFVFFIQCFFEGSGNEAFLAFIMMGLMPEFFATASGALASATGERSAYASNPSLGRTRMRPSQPNG